MKSIILALALVAIAAALPVEKEPVKILRSQVDQNPDGSYTLSFESEDGTIREEVGTVKEILDEEKKPHTVVIMRGSYSYFDDKGTPQSITYFADDTGFHAEGESIPKIPEPVLRS